MRTIARVLATTLLVLVALTTLAVPAMSQDAKLAVPCLPLGVDPEVLSWSTTEPPQALRFASESGVAYAGFREVLGDSDRHVAIIWVRGRILAVDPNPDDPNFPVWYDAGLTDGKTLYDQPKERCQWKQVAPPEQTPPPPASPPTPPAKPNARSGVLT